MSEASPSGTWPIAVRRASAKGVAAVMGTLGFLPFDLDPSAVAEEKPGRGIGVSKYCRRVWLIVDQAWVSVELLGEDRLQLSNPSAIPPRAATARLRMLLELEDVGAMHL